VTSVAILPADRGAVAVAVAEKDGGDVTEEETGETTINAPPTTDKEEPQGSATPGATGTEDDAPWYEAHVELSTRREAYLIANYPWKPWDAPILNIDSILIEGVLHDHPRYCTSGRRLRPPPAVRRQPHMEQQRVRHRRQGEIRTGLWTLRNKKQVLERQRAALEKQLELHQRVLSLLKDNKLALVSDQRKKYKVILEVQKKLIGVRRELLNDIAPEIKKLEDEEETLRAETEAAAVAAAAASTVGGSIVRPFQLDRRSTVLRVDGLGKDAPLEDVRVLFCGYGAVTNVEWLVHETDGEKGVEVEGEREGESPSGVSPAPPLPTLLVHCANRGVAERIRTNCKQYNGAELIFAWHCGMMEKPHGVAVMGKSFGVAIGSGDGAVLEDVTAMENSVVEVDGNGGAGGDGTGDKSMYWTEDDDLMVDYDDEEG